MTQLDQIKTKIDKALYDLRFFDAGQLDNVNTITTSSTGTLQDTHQIHLASGQYDGKDIEGKDIEGNNIHLPVEYIVDIN